MEYALKIIYNTMAVVIIAAIGSWLLGSVSEVITAMIGFGILRFFSGGIHIKSSDLCVLVSAGLLIAASLGNISVELSTTIQYITLVVVIIFSPYNIVTRYKWKPAYMKLLLKSISLGLVLINNYIINSDILTLAFFIQGILLINKSLGRETWSK
jgi:accessory gene regulator B